MSRIRRLSIRGIRNFGDESDEAQIRFSRPLTLILGPNGTGKTTVIEALKFATCGEFPPGSERGKFFIHNPYLKACSSIRGVVKAEVIDPDGNTYTICRTIESSRTTNVTTKFKTLDSTLSLKPKNSEKVQSITHRCADVDMELSVALRVSKPILEYVIFCHQDDLSWPFQEGKKLKERFDEIFASANFNKANDAIIKQTKGLKQELNVLKAERKSCQIVVDEVVEKETKLNDYKKRLAASKVKIEEFNKRIEPLIQKIKKLEKTDAEYKDLQIEEKRKKAEWSMYNQQVERLQKNMEYIFEGTTEELVKRIDSYEEELMGKVGEIGEFEAKLKDVTSEESKISNSLANERVTNGSLIQQLKDQEKKIASRNKMLNDTLLAFDMEKAEPNISELEVMLLYTRLKEKLCELEKRVGENRVKREVEERELQTVVDGLRNTFSKVESEKNIKENERSEVRQEITNVKSEIMQVNKSMDKLNSIELKIKEMQSKIQQLSETMNVDIVKEKITEEIKSRNEIEALLTTIDDEIASLLKQSSLQAELDLNKSTLLTKEKEIEKLKNKHKENIMILFDMNELPQSKLKNKLDMVQKELTHEIELINRDIQNEDRQTTTLETTILHIEQYLKNKRIELEENKKKVSLICNYKNFDDALLLQSRKVKDLHDKRGMYAHQGVAYKEYMRQLRETNPCCPLCHRGFEKREAVINLLKEMETEMENHPIRLNQCDKDLRIQQEKYDEMLQLKPLVETIKQIENVELEKLTNDLEISKNKLSVSQMKLTELKEKKSKPERKLTICKEIMGDIMLWDRYIDETSKLRQTIDDFHARMTSAGIKSKRSLKEAQSQREELNMSLKNIRNNIEELQSKINTYNEQMNNARQKYNALHEEQLKIQAGMQKVKELKNKQEALFSKEISLGKLIDTLKQKLIVADGELRSGIDELERKKKQNSEKQETDNCLYADANKQLSELQSMQNDVDSFMYNNIPQALESSKTKIKKYETSLNRLSTEKDDIETKISKVKEEIARNEVRKRELSDNMTLRKTKDTAKKFEQQYLSIREKLNAVRYSEIVEELKDLQEEEQSLLREKNTLEGREAELQSVVQQSTEELRKEMYRQARKKLKSKCIELAVKEQVASNLEAYSKALDRAMMIYHEERMTKVNRIMKKLWQAVYKGTDTTSIQIRTDATQGIGSAKRTYNYKLVQTKHGHDMDMRGRCSAGQKVLASIIIRLALAETFCKNCGILALDEPTTNLDQENADSLAAALATIVKLRAQHERNFQLIVISHDDKFLFKLAALSTHKGFYQLYRKPSGYTTVKYCLVENRDYTTSEVAEELSSDEESNDEPSVSSEKLKEKTSSRREVHDLQSHNKKRTLDDYSDDSTSDGRSSKRRFVLNQ